MSLLSFFQRKGSAPAARDRLQLLLAYERSQNGRPDITAILQKEILEVIQRHFPIDPDKVQVKLDHGGAISTLEIDIEMPGMEIAKA